MATIVTNIPKNLLWLTKITENFVTRSQELRTFGFGKADNVNSYTKEYPYLWLTPISSDIIKNDAKTGYSAVETEFEVEVGEIIRGDEENMKETVSNVGEIVLTYLREISFHPYYAENEISVTGDAVVDYEFEQDDDIVNKAILNITFRYPFSSKFCEDPVLNIEGYTFNGVNPSQGTQIFDIYINGVTFSSDILTLDRNDGESFSVDLSQYSTDTFINSLTYSNNDLIITRNDGVSFSTTIETTSEGLYVTSSGFSSTIRKDQGHTASGTHSFIGSGLNNINSGSASVIVGGCGNSVTDEFSSIVGGSNNIISGEQGFIGGGARNTVSCVRGFVGGGAFNNNGGCRSFIGGGCSNILQGDESVLVGGINNEICQTKSFIGGGSGNTVDGIDSAITGGLNNTVSDSCSNISGGVGNNVSGNSSGIGSGNNNTVSDRRSFIGGGVSNTNSGRRSTLAGGCSNDLTNDSAFIGAGTNNTNGGQTSFIGAGFNNTINNVARAAIVVGRNNVLNTGSNCSGIFSGQNNEITGINSFIANGESNTINSSGGYAALVTGEDNLVTGKYSTIVNGFGNTASGTHSFVTGDSNTDAGFQNVNILGKNISASRENTTFVNNLNIESIPTSSAGLPSGAVWNDSGTLKIV